MLFCLQVKCVLRCLVLSLSYNLDLNRKVTGLLSYQYHSSLSYGKHAARYCNNGWFAIVEKGGTLPLLITMDTFPLLIPTGALPLLRISYTTTRPNYSLVENSQHISFLF